MLLNVSNNLFSYRNYSACKGTKSCEQRKRKMHKFIVMSDILNNLDNLFVVLSDNSDNWDNFFILSSDNLDNLDNIIFLLSDDRDNWDNFLICNGRERTSLECCPSCPSCLIIKIKKLSRLSDVKIKMLSALFIPRRPKTLCCRVKALLLNQRHNYRKDSVPRSNRRVWSSVA